MRAVGSTVIIVACGILLIGSLVMFEHRFIFFPYRELVARPADYGLAADEVSETTDDGVRLHGWWIRGRGERVLVWYHGNAGNISHRLENAKLIVDRLGLDILLVDYRGYGLSEGTPDEQGLYRDGLAMYADAVARFPPERIVLFGRSVGASIAVEVALTKPSGAIILETPFRSVPAMARELYPFVPRFLIRTRFDNEAKIARLRAPVLILHGDRDDIVPLSHARRLFDLAPEPKRFFLIRGASHNDTYLVGGEEYWRAWEEFLGDSLQVKSKK